jgi:hypothetical protein
MASHKGRSNPVIGTGSPPPLAHRTSTNAALVAGIVTA